MPKNICKVLIVLLALSAIAAVTLQISCNPSSLSQEEASTQAAPSMGDNLPANEQAERLAPVSAKLMAEQNLSSHSQIQFIYTIATLLAMPMIITGYLYYKWWQMVYKSSLFFKG